MGDNINDSIDPLDEGAWNGVLSWSSGYDITNPAAVAHVVAALIRRRQRPTLRHREEPRGEGSRGRHGDGRPLGRGLEVTSHGVAGDTQAHQFEYIDG